MRLLFQCSALVGSDPGVSRGGSLAFVDPRVGRGLLSIRGIVIANQ